MKNTIKLLTLFLVIFFVACDKDSTLNEEEIQNEDLTGESLPEIFSGDDSYLKIELTEKEQMIVDFDEAVVQNDGQVELDDNLSRARRIEQFKLGWTINSNTYGQGNTFHTRGNDRMYKMIMTETAKIKITLNKLHSDLDLYLYKPVGYRNNVRRMARSSNDGNLKERIEITLSPGTYYIVVDAYSADGPFELHASKLHNDTGGNGCEPSGQSCQSFESYSVYRGITAQSSSWKKWSSSANDGAVKYENSSYSNKVVKFDYRRYGRQDVVKSMANKTLGCGKHHLSFKMYKAHGKKAKFASIKSSQFRNSNLGFLIDIREDGQVVCKQGNRTKRTAHYVPSNEWVTVYMTFDIDDNDVFVDIVSSRTWTSIRFSASATAFNQYSAQKSIWGLNFYADNSSVKYHIDRVCTTKPRYPNRQGKSYEAIRF